MKKQTSQKFLLLWS